MHYPDAYISTITIFFPIKKHAQHDIGQLGWVTFFSTQMIIIESDAITKSFSTICLLNIMTRWRLLLLCTTVSFQIFSEIEHCTQISADRKWIDVMAISDNFINRQMIFFVCPLYQCHIQLHAPHHKERMLLCNWLRRSNWIFFVILEISVMIRPSMFSVASVFWDFCFEG